MQAGLSTGDGLYTILAGSTLVQVFCDMTNGGYTLLNDQDIAQGYLPSDTWKAGVNTTAPNGGQWGILNLASSFQNDGGGFEFRMTFGQSQTAYAHWYQTGDPSTGTRGTLSGVTMSPANQLGCGLFDGLADDSQGETAWDGNSNGCWWFAVGSAVQYGSGIPAYDSSDAGDLVTDRVRLWVRKNGPARLAAWYPLDEGAGTVLKDISGGNNAGLTSGGSSWTTDAACHSGACVTMNGGGYAAATNNAAISFGTGPFTATAWVKTTSNGAEEVLMGNNRCFVAEGWLLSMESGLPSFATFGPGSSNGYIQSPSAANDGQWHFIAGVRTPTGIALYVDGTQVATGSVSASYSSDSGNAELQIGNLNSCARGFNGSLDDLRLYAGALTQSEISALAQTQSCAARLGCGGATPNCAVTVGSPVYGQMVGTVPTADHSGISGGALSFSFSDNLTFSNNSIPNGGDARSMSFWMKSTQNSPGCMVNYGIFSAGERFGVLISSDNEYFVGENVDLPGVNEIDDGSWHHVLVTYDGTTLTLYRDGLFEVDADLGLNTGSSDVFIGTAVAGHSPEFYVGQLDDLRFYDRALSPSEAALVYSGDVSMKTTTSGLAAWYLLNGDGSEEAARCGP